LTEKHVFLYKLLLTLSFKTLDFWIEKKDIKNCCFWHKDVRKQDRDKLGNGKKERL